MEASRQCLALARLPQEVVDLILEHVLRGVLELRDSADLDDNNDKPVLASSNAFVELNQNLKLLRLEPPGGNTLLRHATFAFANLSNGGLNLKAVCHLNITREQLQIDCSPSRPACLDRLDSLRTLTMREKMRAGANSYTMRSVRFRLKADRLLQWIAGQGGENSEGGGSEKPDFLQRAAQRMRLILQLSVETGWPLPLMVSNSFMQTCIMVLH